MNEPKAFLYPRIYFRDARHPFTERFRIIYPNGKAEWWTTMIPKFKKPCWNMQWAKNGEKALERMREYDSKYGIEAEFVGEIR